MVIVCLQVQERFEVDIKGLPEQIDTSTYSMSYVHDNVFFNLIFTKIKFENSYLIFTHLKISE